MVNLKNYFYETCDKHAYYNYHFHNLLTGEDNSDEFFVFDEQEAIDEFRKLIQPYDSKKSKIDNENDNKFIYLCNYLNDIGYYIEEFPSFLERPTKRWDLSYNKIRKAIIERDGYNGKVSWKDRRIFVNNLKFIKNNKYTVSEDIIKILKIVSTRGAEFNNMTLDEKLGAICNSIEYLLKPNKESNKFIILDYSDTDGYLSNDIVKGYRNKLQCFRHSTKEDISERANYKDIEKNLYINFGVVIIDYINSKLNNN